MLDFTIVDTLASLTPPTRPEMVIEERYEPPQIQAVRRMAERRLAVYRDVINQWIASLDRAREMVERVVDQSDLTSTDYAQITDLIEEWEADAELRANSVRRFAKKVERDAKRLFAIDPALGAAVRAVGQQLIEEDKRAIEAQLDYALFMRAFRAEFDPETRGGPVFNDPDDLEAYLRQATAA